VRITVRHRVDLGQDRSLVGDDLIRPDAWDALRIGTSGPFALPAARADWERAADAIPWLASRAAAVDALLGERGVRRLASYGAGAGFLELALARRAPERELVAADYAEATVARLRELFAEAEVVRHDLRTDPPLVADLHLFHRIDTELADRDWRAVLRRFAGEAVLFVPSEVVDWREAWRRSRRGRAARTTAAGWLRNGAAFESLWRRTHRAAPVALDGAPAWLLEPR
jgi:hypothetical protein